jgi:hypothetical protein
MGVEAKPDFSGWATKAGLKCSDGRVIMPDAFKHQDQATVPLVWQHGHSEPANVLGHAVLENRGEEGVYAYGYFNTTDAAKNAKVLVEHGDIKSLSIYANGLVERSKQVFHGVIRELSLVLSGANPGALIDNITLAHADGDMVTLEDEAIIYTGLELVHSDDSENSVDDSADDSADEAADEAADDSSDDSADNASGGPDMGADELVEHSAEDPTVQEVYDSLTPEQKNVVHYMIGAALESASGDLQQSSTSDDGADDGVTDDALVHTDNANEEEGRRMTRNVFEQQNGGPKVEDENVLTHDALKGIVTEAKKSGSLKEAFENYAFKHGIENIDVLFPDARSVTDTPEFDSRRIEWVAGVLDGTRHSPFTRIKSLMADLTYDDARARGYIKGNLKKEEWFGVSKRVTTPATIYKKQKLDRDDIIDITDFDVVMWLKAEMRLMLDEELARAILIGDGRLADDEDKIKDPVGALEGAGIRSILNDHDLYAATAMVDDGATSIQTVDAIVDSMKFYKGSGSPTFYTSLPVLTSLLLTRDQFLHRMWKTPAELASELGVANIVTVEVMESETDLIGIIVNLRDYTLGTDKGGEVNFFDDFDIDYNQYKYLYETRLSGALTKLRSAVVVKRSGANTSVVAPTAPTFDGEDITIPTVADVTYKNRAGDGTVTGTVNVPVGDTVTIYAIPADSGHYFANNVEDEWSFTNRG